MTGLVWYRNDLRTLDHPALHSASSTHRTLRAVYFLCPAQLDEHVIAPIRRHYLRRALDELATQLAALGIPFDIVNAGHFSGVAAALSDYCQRHRIDTAYAHREWLLDEMRRDQHCIDAGIPLQLLNDALIAPPDLLKNDGQPYKVFTPFSKRCRQTLLANFPTCLRRPTAAARPVKRNRPCPPFGEERDSGDWPVAEDDILEALRRFCRERSWEYRSERDFPALDATSRLSPALSLGLLSARQCLARLLAEAGDRLWDAQSGPGTWLNELLWREFYRYIAFHFPRVVRGRAFQTDTDALRWRDSDSDFDAWCSGQTGFPIVDAAMRQLNDSGWMHNRLRMISASFLCKDLQLDWRRGERYFLSRLIDADFASNNGGWQWAASTGTDAVPYFRIFNPQTQSERFDPDGRFLLSYLPELAGCPIRERHAPPPTAGYPSPIVDHRVARELSLDMFRKLRGQG